MMAATQTRHHADSPPRRLATTQTRHHADSLPPRLADAISHRPAARAECGKSRGFVLCSFPLHSFLLFRSVRTRLFVSNDAVFATGYFIAQFSSGYVNSLPATKPAMFVLLVCYRGSFTVTSQCPHLGRIVGNTLAAS